VYYEVDYGPMEIKDDKLAVAGLPANPRYPFGCKVTAWQIGRRAGETIATAQPVSVTFQVVKP
jgi:hypothetical protein